ncbi:hypothetical protein [Alicyclobacillus fastidiosus]|nr:hypothetical protein [Alicyclobacillus fastidiosus]GMA65944.1 hypothetical protein GCM10025859_63860 [Alicyclobacillus fastidiosus]GMA66164.1 hypothetical protein GCM10025859_66060 [Alicyclobacillus fastidiosus]
MIGALLKVFQWGSKVNPADPLTVSNLDDFFDLLDTARQMIGW